MNELNNQNPQIILYQTESRQTKIEVRSQDETVWVTQKLIAKLLQTASQSITLHLNNIYAENELFEGATCKELLQVQNEAN